MPRPEAAPVGAACETCGAAEDVRMESSRTMYPWDGAGEDPNRDRALCRPCAEEHHRHWDEMWAQARP